MWEHQNKGGALDIDVYVRCDHDPYGLEKLFCNLKIGGETVYREQYYAVEIEGQNQNPEEFNCPS